MNDLEYLNIAYQLAQEAYNRDEVPVGAIIVMDGQVIGKGYNLRQSNKSIIDHAEIICLIDASKHLEAWNLTGAKLYVTLEPCCMCLSAIIQARISEVIYGAIDPKSGAAGGLFNLLEQPGFNHYPKLKYLQHPQSSAILKQFFQKKRNKK